MKNAAIALVEDTHRKNYFLWIKRRDLPIWVLPGGGIDSGETPEQAVIREVKEESGLDVSIERKTAEYSPINRFTAETHIFLCKWEKGSPETGEESADINYFHINSPPKPSFPLHVDWMFEALNNPNKIIKRPLNEFKWTRVAGFFLKHPLILLKYLFS